MANKTDMQLIIERLKTGTIKNVFAYPFRTSTTPYVLITKEGAKDDKYLISVHSDSQIEIDDYIEFELCELLENPITENGGQIDERTITPYPENEITKIVVNDDNSLSRDRFISNPVNRRD